MSYAMKSGCYEIGMKEKNPIKTLTFDLNNVIIFGVILNLVYKKSVLTTNGNKRYLSFKYRDFKKISNR